jgi:hypothetical protein
LEFPGAGRNDVEPPPSDEATVFMTYLSFLGDAQKTAVALNLPLVQVEQLAIDNQWGPKVEALRALGREGGADTLARELNRVKSFIQATRLFNIVDRVIRYVTQNDESFNDFVTNHGKDNSNTTCKAVAELVKAAEIAQGMLYRAVGDSLGERTARNETGGIATDLLKALAGMGAAGIQKPVVAKIADAPAEPTTGPG